MKKTKIIATLWPATNNEKTLEKIYKAWVNIIRFNFSHANYEDSLKSIEVINKLNTSGKTNLSLLLDTKWPEIRTWNIENKNIYKKWDVFKIYTDPNHKIGHNDLFCDYETLSKDIEVWKNIVIDSGLLWVKVLEKHKSFVKVRANNFAEIWSRRHVNLPWVKLRLPWITKKDVSDIEFAIKNNFDFIAASFIRHWDNVKEIKELFEKHKVDNIKIISKIENQEAIDNLDSIVKESDWLMVARWDLWIEVPIKKLALYQREIVKKTKAAWKFVIIATHLLETMIENPFPTRAESSDIFNSIMQKPDCLMLSWETAIGSFPVESVKMMTSIIKEAEKSIVYSHKDFSLSWINKRDEEKKLLIKSWIYSWEDLKAKCMIILTKTWKLAKIASSFRPNIKVYAFTNREKSVKIMNSYFWIDPIFHDNWDPNDYSKNLELSIRFLISKKLLKLEDRVIAINDIQKSWKEIPVMEIVNVSDLI